MAGIPNLVCMKSLVVRTVLETASSLQLNELDNEGCYQLTPPDYIAVFPAVNRTSLNLWC